MAFLYMEFFILTNDIYIYFSFIAIAVFKIYYGCGGVNIDWTRKLIETERGERCIHAIDYLFWKRPEDS